MKQAAKLIELKLERTIPAAPGEVFDAWLNPKVPGNPWHMADKLLLNAEVDGFFYWKVQGTPHYGRFIKVDRPGRIQHTWMSPNTAGLESMVTVTFKKKKAGTSMTLVHTGLPDTDQGRSHSKGWTYFLDAFNKQLAGSAAS
jgi:uncharacterized protein YndB with AHSA1/START domain